MAVKKQNFPSETGNVDTNANEINTQFLCCMYLDPH